MDALLDVTVLFAFLLTLALLIERLFEIVKSIYDFLDSRFNWYTFWTKRAKKLGNLLEKRMNVFEYVDPKTAATVSRGFQELILKEREEYSGTIPIISGDLVRAVTIKTIFKFLAIAIGICLAFWFKIDLIAIWQNTHAELTESALNINSIDPKIYGIILSGIAIGLGSGPVHKVIIAIERKRDSLKKKGGKQ